MTIVEFPKSANTDVIQAEGEAALKHLVKLAQGSSGQCRIIAKFLLGLYNGPLFPFDLTDFRALDESIFTDCLAVLSMDYTPKKEVHCYIPDGEQIFEQLARDWNIKPSPND